MRKAVDSMLGLRLKITLLVMGAIIATSLIGIAAAFGVMMADHDGEGYILKSSKGAAHLASNGGGTSFLDMVPSELVGMGFSLLIVSCAISVGIIVANMVARPLMILRNAVESVNPRDFIPPIEEAKLQSDLGATKLLNTLSGKLRTTMETRMRLVAAAGHDLRTPITRMRLRAEFIEDAEERAQWEKDINEMAHIAESAMALVSEEIGPGSNEPIDIEMMLHDLISELAEIDLDVRLTGTKPAMVKGGFHSMKRALSNLIINAATHGGSTEVSLHIEGTNAIIVISDDGPGIPEASLSMAFEPFFRANAGGEKRKNGAGLGLSIARELIERHGGRIVLENKETGGLLQTISIPLDHGF